MFDSDSPPPEDVQYVTVSFDSQGGTKLQDEHYETGGVYGHLPEPMREGYAFCGWYTAEENSVKVDETNEVLGSRTLLIAKWVPLIFRITLDKQGGSSGLSVTEATFGSPLPKISVPTRKGYKFLGYFTGTNGTGLQYYNSDGIGLRDSAFISDTVLYASWFDELSVASLTIKNGVLTKVEMNNASTVTIPNTVNEIGSMAFADCIQLSSVIIPASVTKIGTLAFLRCYNLKTVRINGAVQTIPWGCFDDCIALQTVMLPNSLKTIEGSAFGNCESLTSISLPYTLESIGDFAFQESGLKTIYLGSNCVGLGAYVFSACKNLQKISVASDNACFAADATGLFILNKERTKVVAAAGSLENAIVPDTVTQIGEFAFYNCLNLKSVILPEGLESIEARAFQRTILLTDITIPSTVTNIGASAFLESGLKGTLYIPNSVHSIGSQAFGYCCELTTIRLPEGIKEISNSLFSGCKKIEEMIIPEGVTNIQRTAFNDCINLKNIKIPNSVAKIGTQVFYNCQNLQRIELPESVREIGSAVFMDCYKLQAIDVSPQNEFFLSRNGYLLNKEGEVLIELPTGLDSVAIPEGVSVITNTVCYYNRQVQSVKFPSTLRCIKSSSFNNCASLTNITFLGDAPTELGSGVFSRLNSKCTIKVLANSSGWGCNIPGTWNGLPIEYASCIHTQEPLIVGYVAPTCQSTGYSGDATCAVCGEILDRGVVMETTNHDEGLGIITLEATPSAKGEKTYFCKVCGSAIRTEFLPRINPTEPLWDIDGNGTLIGVELDGFTDAKIPDGVKNIGTKVFSNSEVTSVTIPSGVTNIAISTFENCTKLTNVIFQSTSVNVADYAFRGCSSLSAIICEGRSPHLSNLSFERIPEDCIAIIPYRDDSYTIDVDGTWYGIPVERYGFNAAGGNVSITDKNSYIVTVSGGGILSKDDFKFSTVMDGEIIDTTKGYRILLENDKRTAHITLSTPEFLLPSGLHDYCQNDILGILSSVTEDELSTHPIAYDGEMVCGIRIKTIKGLYYQAAWGSDLKNLTKGEKVRARGDSLYLGVIKQGSERGFYKISVSE